MPTCTALASGWDVCAELYEQLTVDWLILKAKACSTMHQSLCWKGFLASCARVKCGKKFLAPSSSRKTSKVGSEVHLVLSFQQCLRLWHVSDSFSRAPDTSSVPPSNDSVKKRWTRVETRKKKREGKEWWVRLASHLFSSPGFRSVT